MITEFLTDIALGLFDWVLSALPDDTITYPDVEGIGTTMGNMVGPFDSFMPFRELSQTIDLSATVVAPVVLAYRLAMFVWAYVPVIGGGS